MVLGKLPVPGRPTNRIKVGQGPTALAVGAGGVVLDIFSLVYHLSLLVPSLWEMARYRLKYCLKGPLSSKQPTNQLKYQRFVPVVAITIAMRYDAFTKNFLWILTLMICRAKYVVCVTFEKLKRVRQRRGISNKFL